MTQSVSTLDDLIAPLTQEEFMILLYLRKLFFERATNGTRYDTLLNWETLRGVIESGKYPQENLRVVKESVPILPLFFMNGRHLDADKIEALLSKGASLILLPIEQYVPTLSTLCNNIKSVVRNEKIQAGAIVTTGKGGALKLHYDIEDLIVLQLEGSKRWQIRGPAVSNPVIDMPEELPPEHEAIFDEVLQPGDFLFIPGGYWHHCENGLGRSIHLGILFTPPTAWHAVKELTSRIVSEEAFRIPLSRLAGEPERALREAELKSRLREIVGELSLNDFISLWNEKA